MSKLIILAVLLISIIGGFAFWKFSTGFLPASNAPSGPVKLTYWGFEDESSAQPLIDEYIKQNPTIQIAYSKQSLINYRSRLQTQIKEGVGPDVFKIHNSWVGMLSDSLVPAPVDVFTTGDYQTTFFQVASDSFVINNQILGVPSVIDGLVLFYNPAILSAAGVGVPQTWQQLIDAATKVTVKDSSGQIKTAGLGLGTSTNVDYWSDILGLLLLQQPGVDLVTPSGSAAEVLSFYTGFVTDPRKKTWDVNLSSSTTMFTSGNLAFYLAPISKAAELKQSNPNLQFGTTTVPQLPGRNVAWASLWGEGVSRSSKSQKEAWKFLKFLSQKDLEKQKPLKNDPLYQPAIAQGPYYKFWYLESNTQDGGINDEMITLWQGAVSQILAGQSAQTVVSGISPKVKPILDKYSK